LTLGWVYLVELAKIANVALTGARSPCLQPTELRRRKHEAFCGFVKAESSVDTKLAQQEPQLTPPDCRIGLAYHFDLIKRCMTLYVPDETLRYAWAFCKSKTLLRNAVSWLTIESEGRSESKRRRKFQLTF
jgi:hypothetical protein